MNTEPTDHITPNNSPVGRLEALYLDNAVYSTIENLTGDDLLSVQSRLRGILKETPLCISFISIVELARGNLSRERMALAEFLGEMPTVWLRPEDVLEDGEVRSYVKSPVAGPFGSANPFGSSIIDVLRSLDRTEQIGLHDRTWSFSALLRKFHGSGAVLLNKFLARTGGYMMELRKDRINSPYKNNSRKGRVHTDGKVVRRLTNCVFKRLNTHPKDAAIFSEVMNIGNTDVAEHHIELKPTDIPKFPIAYLRHEFNMIRGSRFPDIPEEVFKRLAGSEAADNMHLGGAAYFRYFSCDKRTNDAIKRARGVLGLPAPLVLRGVNRKAVEDFLDLMELQRDSAIHLDSCAAL